MSVNARRFHLPRYSVIDPDKTIIEVVANSQAFQKEQSANLQGVNKKGKRDRRSKWDPSKGGE
jgi:hypothetical protein